MRQDVSNDVNTQAKLRAMVRVKRENNACFPVMLHRMLADIEELGRKDPDMQSLQKIVSWDSEGTAFKIHDKKKFASLLMPIWFMRIKYTSWIRQLNTYGFKKVHDDGPKKGALYHESFVRDMPELARQILKVPKKKQQQQSAEGRDAQPSPTTHCSALPKFEASTSSSSVSQTNHFTGTFLGNAMLCNMPSLPPVSHSQTPLQAEASLAPFVGSTGPLSGSFNSRQSSDLPNGTFGRVMNALEMAFDNDESIYLQSNARRGDNYVFDDLEPVPFPTELSVAENNWMPHNYNLSEFPPMAW